MSTPFWYRVTDDQGNVVAEGPVTSYGITAHSAPICGPLGGLVGYVSLGSTIRIEGDVSNVPVPKKNVLIDDLLKVDACECGATKATGIGRGAGHSSWCPWSKS